MPMNSCSPPTPPAGKGTCQACPVSWGMHADAARLGRPNAAHQQGAIDCLSVRARCPHTWQSQVPVYQYGGLPAVHCSMCGVLQHVWRTAVCVVYCSTWGHVPPLTRGWWGGYQSGNTPWPASARAPPRGPPPTSLRRGRPRNPPHTRGRTPPRVRVGRLPVGEHGEGWVPGRLLQVPALVHGPVPGRG